MNYYSQLTPRQKEVIRLIARGYSTQEVAKNLCITTHTVKSHIAEASARTGAGGIKGGVGDVRCKLVTIYWKNNIEELKDFQFN